jgi:colanic acid/amylovoran biosynthesis glycosyltransferase
MTDTRTAYLVSQYPKLSHAFIEREIRALREIGVEVRTFSVRPAAAAELLTETDRAESANTTALLASKATVVRAVLRLARTHPGALATGLRMALRTGPATVRSRLWQLFYVGEATLLLDQMREAGLHHVHVHLANNGADIARLAVVMGPKIDGDAWSWSFSMHGPTEFYSVESFDLAAKVRAASFVACISDFCRSQLMMLVEPEHWDKLAIVHMSVDLDRYPMLAEKRQGRGGPLRVLFVGRLTPEKAPHVLVEGVSLLPRGSVELQVIGAGPEKAALERQVARLGLAGVAQILGPRGQDELLEHYEWADVFCLPSFAEGVPVVLMEAMATGLPVVTTHIAGIPELVDDGVNGLLVAPGRSDLIADALGSLAHDGERRERLGEAGRAKVQQGFTPLPNVQALKTLLDGL